jgi:hypothetical protein
LPSEYKQPEKYDFSFWAWILTNYQGTCSCSLRLEKKDWLEVREPGSHEDRLPRSGQANSDPSCPGSWESILYPKPLLLIHREVPERELPEGETFLNKSFNFSPVDTAALTQSHIWGMMSQKPGTTECFSTGTRNCCLLRVVLCSVLSMWYLNWSFSWPPKGNSFKRKNF